MGTCCSKESNAVRPLPKLPTQTSNENQDSDVPNVIVHKPETPTPILISEAIQVPQSEARDKKDIRISPKSSTIPHNTDHLDTREGQKRQRPTYQLSLPAQNPRPKTSFNSGPIQESKSDVFRRQKFTASNSRKSTIGKNAVLENGSQIKEINTVPKLETLEEEDRNWPKQNSESLELNYNRANTIKETEESDVSYEPVRKDSNQQPQLEIDTELLYVEPNQNPSPVNSEKQQSPDGSLRTPKRKFTKLHSFYSIPINRSNFIPTIQGRFSDYYKIQKPIGEGASGLVNIAEHIQSKVLRAVKSVYKSSYTEEDATRMFYEFDTIKQLDHPNILKLYEVIDDRHKYHLVTELYTGGELFERICNEDGFTEQQAGTYMYQIFSAMKYWHLHQVVHRDLKPENILLQTQEPDSELVIIDFGTSRVVKEKQKMSKTYGTVFYMPPEVIAGDYDQKCDVWSAGVILYILLCGFVPFGGDTDAEIFDSIKNQELEFFSPEWDVISDDVKDLLSKMLERDLEKRFSMDQCFNHRWVLNSRANQNKQPVISSDCLHNLKNYRASRKLEKAVVTFISSQLTSIDETNDLKKMFQMFDENGDGKLSREELCNGYKGVGIDIDDIDTMINEWDVDGSGFIDYTEFIAATINKQKILSKEKLETAFHAFDTDGSGKIGIDELKQLLERDEKLADDSEWIKVITEADSNGDGEIDLTEFKDLMLRLI